MASQSFPHKVLVSQQSSRSCTPVHNLETMLPVLPTGPNMALPSAPPDLPPALPRSHSVDSLPARSDLLSLLAEHLGHAQRTLAEQHEATLCFLARHLETPGTNGQSTDLNMLDADLQDQDYETPTWAAPCPPHNRTKTPDIAPTSNFGAPLRPNAVSDAALLVVQSPSRQDAAVHSSGSPCELISTHPAMPDDDVRSECWSQQEPKEHANSIAMPVQNSCSALSSPVIDVGRQEISTLSRYTLQDPHLVASHLSQSNEEPQPATQAPATFQVLPCWNEPRGEQATMARNGSGYEKIQHLAAEKTQGYSTRQSRHSARVKKLETDSCFKNFMLSPNGRFRLVWDLGSLGLVLYDMVVIPLSFFFEEGYTTLLLTTMEWVTRIWWSLDMTVSVLSGFVDRDGSIEMRPLPVFKKYFRSWLGLDVLVVGSDWFEVILTIYTTSSGGGAVGMLRVGKMSKIFRILRLLRLLRLAKMGEILSVLTERLPSETLVIFFDIIKLVMFMLTGSHFVACIFYAIGTLEYDKSDPRRSNWVETFGYAEEDLSYKYIMSLRWALSQYAGGMDEVVPVSLEEHVFCASILIISFWSGTVILSILTSHMTQLYLMGSQQQQQVNLMRRYLRQHGVSKGLTMRVQRNAQYTLHLRAKEMPESMVGLDDLVSAPLRVELHFEMYSPTLTRHGWFRKFTEECPHVVRQVCHTAMKGSFVAKGDTLFNAGEQAVNMWFCKSGELDYSWMDEDGDGYDDEIEGHLLEPGKWLSEPILWTPWLHRGILVASLDSQVFYLVAKDFVEVVKSFKWMKMYPYEYAQEFVRLLNELEFLSDLPFDIPHWINVSGRGVHNYITKKTSDLSGSFAARASKWVSPM